MKLRLGVLLLLLACSVVAAQAEVVRWEILKREPYADGKPRGDRGAYERWTGTVHFAVDPANKFNEQIVDLPLAAKNKGDKVEFYADFEMLVPADRTKANGALFYEVNNRGNKTSPGIFDGGADDFLLRQGYIVLSSGWIAEVQPGGGRLRLQAPVPLENGKPLRGIVRNELVVDKVTPRASISHRGNQGSYRPASDAFEKATLTFRLLEADKRQLVPRDRWQLLEVRTNAERGQLPILELEVKVGLQPGFIYEVIYEAEGSLVQGAGLAGIRDIVAALKYGTTDEINPLKVDGKPVVNRAIGFGTSQSGRCLRQFLWDGFNADEEGRMVFDGVIPHVAGGGLGSFNHRFASPTRTNGQHEEHLFPADYFPFAYGEETDPLTDKRDGILSKSRATKTTPKVFHTQSSSEYWHRSGSLVHTDPLGKRDSEIPPEVRLYTFGGTQHGAGSGVPGERTSGQFPSNPADYRPLMRALLVALDAWIKDGVEPPPSQYPRIADGTLIDWQAEKHGYPGFKDTYPKAIQTPPGLYRGPHWDDKRIATIEPPEIKLHYVVKVPGYGPDGNERGTLNLPAISVPVATYTSWNLRNDSIGAAGELLSLQGGYVPLPRVKSDRDTRPALRELYKDYADYEAKYLDAAQKLVAERYLLDEDLPRLKELCQKFKGQFAP